MGNIAAQAMQGVNGNNYEVGGAADLLYAAAGTKKLYKKYAFRLHSTLTIYFQVKRCNIIYNFHVTGGSDDWAQGGAGIRYAFTMELPPRGNPGFVLPKEQILPVGREVFAGVAAMMNKLIDVTGTDFTLKVIFPKSKHLQNI